jgi:hypothetical protein
VLLLFGLVAGLAGGSIGINGPPIVVAFTILKDRLSKDDMRSISVSYFFLELMAVRLPLLVSSGLLKVAPGTAAGIACAAVLGLTVGSALRSHVDTEKIITVLVLLVFASAWLMTIGASGEAAPAVEITAMVASAALLTVLLIGICLYRRRAQMSGSPPTQHKPRLGVLPTTKGELQLGAVATSQQAGLDPPAHVRVDTV